MTSNETHLDRRSYLKTAGVATAGMIGLAGCSADGNGPGNGGNGTGGDSQQQYGTLSTAVTDQPNDIGDFEELIVTIDGIWVKPAGGQGDDEEADADETPENGTETAADGTETESDGQDASENQTDDAEATDAGGEDSDDGQDETGDEDTATESDDESDDADESERDEETESENEDGEGSGRRYIEFEEPQQADLVQLQGSETQLVDETELEAGQYQFLQLDVSDTTGTLADSGEEADVETPGEAPLKFNKSFEIRAEEQTRFIADFAPHQTGQGKYIIRPVATGTTVLYGDEEYDPEGDGGSTEDGQSDGQAGNGGQAGTDGKAGNDGAGGDGTGGDGGADGGNEAASTATPTPSDD
jgi:hypothetical protein